MRPKISRIAIRGFRGFGSVQQIAEPSQTVSVFWGGNSNGKTSFGEAIEFLLTGQIARRELLAGAKDEFADSLRNAHIDDAHEVSVEIVVLDVDGKERAVKRTLVCDYQRGSAAGCTSTLTIDGEAAENGDLQTSVGLSLFPAPLQAPVLSQQSLGFLFSSSPADRAAYFRALLDTQDLEDFRKDVAELEQSLVKPASKEIDSVLVLQGAPAFSDTAKSLLKCKNKAAAEKILTESIRTVLIQASLPPEGGLDNLVRQLRDELERRRSLVFPVQLLGRSPFVQMTDYRAHLEGAASDFGRERAACDQDAARLIGLFAEALKIEHFGEHAPEHCPLCGADKSLTDERVSWIREQALAAEGYKSALEALLELLARIATLLDTMRTSARNSLPSFLRIEPGKRRKSGFTCAVLQGLGVDDQLVRDWLADLKSLIRAERKVRATIAKAEMCIAKARENVEGWKEEEEAGGALAAVDEAQVALIAAIASYDGPVRRLGEALTSSIDRSTAVAGWDALATLGADPEGAIAAATQMARFAAQQKALAKALSEIDKGIGLVQDAKFALLSDQIRIWWDRLRPDEATFFDTIRRRGAKTRRMIDMRAGLSLKDDQSDPKFRDAVAVFSQSQLHCLGLAMFLARASSESVGFIVLDDPVLTSDDDFRPNFASTVIEGLLDEGIQILITTQDHATAKDIETRWDHRDVARFNIIRNDPRQGSEIRNQDDHLAAMIARAAPLCNTQDPEQRKKGGARVRDAIERFCKLILVKDRIGKGEMLASITDYDGKNFSDYNAKVAALLTKSPADPGKLKAAHKYVTPSSHDDTPPPQAQLKVALMDIKRMKADYLD